MTFVDGDFEEVHPFGPLFPGVFHQIALGSGEHQVKRLLVALFHDVFDMRV